VTRHPSASVTVDDRPGRGFTLLEVLLALSLSALVLIAVAMAVDFQLRVVDASRAHIEEAQLARVLLQRIADDIRSVVAYDPLQMEKLAAEAASAAGSAQAQAEEAVQKTEGGSEGPDLEDTDQPQSLQTAEGAESAVPRSIPGLYGGPDWIQVDVARLPRLDQFESLLEPSEDLPLVDRLSDVKTVAYFILSADETGAVQAGDQTDSSGGLIRRELDRAVTLMAAEQGWLDQMQLDLAPLAPEVSSVEFRYSDGTQWLEEWDCEESGGLPAAVEIAITIRPVRREQGSSWQALSNAAQPDEEGSLVYRLVVQLPVARASSSQATEQQTEESGESRQPEQSTEPAGPDAVGPGPAREGSSR